MSIPNPTITQFISTTVHSDTAHNLPHNELLANDSDLQSQINSLSSLVSGNLSIINIQHLAAIPPSYSNPANGTTSLFGLYSKISATSKLLVCWMGCLYHIIQYGVANFYFGFYPKVEGVIPNGGAVYLSCAGDAYEQTSAYVTPWRYITGLGSGTKNIQVEWYYAAGSGIWRGQGMLNCSYMVVEID